VVGAGSGIFSILEGIPHHREGRGGFAQILKAETFHRGPLRLRGENKKASL